VSVEAISWALNLAPVPRDHDGKPRWHSPQQRVGDDFDPAGFCRVADAPLPVVQGGAPGLDAQEDDGDFAACFQAVEYDPVEHSPIHRKSRWL
jgi:hypothetical protein